MYFSPLSLLHAFGFSSLFLWPTCFSGTKFLSQQSFKLGSKTHARQSPFTPAVQRAMQWSNPYQSVCHLYLSYYIIFILFIFIFLRQDCWWYNQIKHVLNCCIQLICIMLDNGWNKVPCCGSANVLLIGFQIRRASKWVNYSLPCPAEIPLWTTK